MDNVLIISVVVLFSLIVVSHMMNKKASEKVHTSITKDLTTAKTELTTALASTKTELTTALTTALAPVKDSVLKIEGDLNTIKPGTVLPGGTILTALLQNALQTGNFVFLEEELNKIFKSPQDANNILFLGNIVVNAGITCSPNDKTNDKKCLEEFTAPVYVTKRKRDGKYIYFVNRPYNFM